MENPVAFSRGLSEKAAKKKVAQDLARQVGETTVNSALMGFAFSAAGASKKAVVNSINTNIENTISVVIYTVQLNIAQDISAVVNSQNLCGFIICRTKIITIIYIEIFRCAFGIKIEYNFTRFNIQRIKMSTLTRCTENNIVLI